MHTAIQLGEDCELTILMPPEDSRGYRELRAKNSACWAGFATQAPGLEVPVKVHSGRRGVNSGAETCIGCRYAVLLRILGTVVFERAFPGLRASMFGVHVLHGPTVGIP